MRELKITIRVTEEERDAWASAAEEEGRQLSDWIRRTLSVEAPAKKKLDGRRRTA